MSALSIHARPIANLTLEGHLDEPQLNAKLRRLPRDARGVLVDCRAMSDYDRSARAAFVEWFRRMPADVGVAVVTSNLLWHSVVAAMGLASGRTMRAFRDDGSARRWLEAR